MDVKEKCGPGRLIWGGDGSRECMVGIIFAWHDRYRFDGSDGGVLRQITSKTL